MIFFLAMLYINLCLIIGVIGRKLPLGFMGFFLLSLVLSPLLSLILLIVMSSRVQRVT